MTLGKKLTLALALALGLAAACGAAPVAQTAPGSYYVSADGDDEANNGLSEGAPFKTLAKAVDAANGSAVKTITILGTLNREGESGWIVWGTIVPDSLSPPRPRASESSSENSEPVFTIANTGTAEILITGKSESEKAVLQGDGKDSVLKITGAGPVRLENVVISGGGGYSRSINGGIYYGGGIYIEESAVTLGKGVTISDNKLIDGNETTRGYGGGVYVSGGSLTMLEGAVISDNGADGGGGVYVDGASSFTMFGGSITNNWASGNGGGGGVYVDGASSFTLSGGSITNNSAGEMTGNGGGVYVDGASSFTMSGGSITNNTLYGGDGGGVSVGKGSFTMSGGSITNNTADDRGGGVYVGSSSVYGSSNGVGSFIMSGGSITGNTATWRGGGGVYVGSGAEFTQDKGTISGNTAGNGEGADVFRQQ